MADPTENLTDVQRQALDRAASLLFRARDEAEEILRSGNLELPDNPFASPCQGTFDPLDGFTSPPHGDVACACPRYKGDGGPCINTFLNFAGGDFGEGTPRRKCGHRPGSHFRMD